MHYFKDCQIEIANGSKGIPRNLMLEADFVLDLTTFKVHKHRYGFKLDMTPDVVSYWLNMYLAISTARILLLTE